MPMSATRNLAANPDRAVRKAAYEAEIAAWKTVDTPIAASMNGIKSQVNVVTKRRGWDSALDEAVHENNIDSETLAAMMAAARESFPDFRRYLKAKAKALGVETLEWYDLFAPLEGGKAWTHVEASDFVAEQFDNFSQKMGDFARRAFRENWVDWEPRPGKIDGAYCCYMGDVSRVLMNFDGTFGNVKTLAHELGHAYHGMCLSTQTPLNRETPSTLAETASIFCETIVKNAVLKTATGKERIAMLEGCLMAPCQTVVDITSRFLFESRVFEARKERDLSATEFCEMMLQTQRETYGDGLASYHPYMWAVKPHYYSVYSFYNFPYMFGLLFSLGLYSIFKSDPESFRDRYDDLLTSTGLANAHELGQRFGFDTRTIEFWRGSFDVVREDIDAFCAEVG
jgi:pepF/M3 family oligoendopeptidase